MPKLMIVVGLALATLAPSVAHAQRAVYVGVFLRDVSRFAQRDGVFDADFDLWAKWRGELDRDAIRIANAADVEQDFLGEEADGSWHSARWRVRGTLRGEFPLHRFPFDRQELPVVLELDSMHGRLVPDLASSSMAERFSVTDWNYHPTFHVSVSSRELSSDLGHLAREGESTTLRRVRYRVRLSRPLAPVVIKLFVPLIIILLVALVSLFVHPSQIEARGGMAVTALLSCFAFQFTVADSLPAVTYVTLADTLFLIGYVFSGCTVGVTILAFALVRRERESAAIWADRALRVALPVLGLIAVWSAVPEPVPVADETVEPPPVMTRHASARDTLRIGTNLIGTVSGSPGAFAGDWGVLHDDPLEGRLVTLVRRAPGVDNESLHLLAGGGVRVTWTLREHLRWSDGTPLTAADLAFAETMTPDPAIASARAVDEHTLVVEWTRALARALDPPWAVQEASFAEIFADGGYEAVRQHRREHPYPQLGPYRVTTFEDGERIVLEANEHFAGAAPSIRRVEILRFERSELVAAFERGAFDMSAPNAITPEQARDASERMPGSTHLRASSLFIFGSLDLEAPALRSREVRRALLTAIDREALVHAVYGDHGRIAHIPIPGELPPEVVTVSHDAEAARAVLEPLGLTLPLYISSGGVDTQIADLLTEQLAAVGVTVDRRVVPSTLRASRERGHGGMVLRVTRGKRDRDPHYWWAIRAVDGHYPPEARNAAYDDEIAAMVQREERSVYPERRDQLRDMLFAEYADRLPSMPLMFAAERLLVAPELRGWDMPPETPFGLGLEHAWFTTGDDAEADEIEPAQ